MNTNRGLNTEIQGTASESHGALINQLIGDTGSRAAAVRVILNRAIRKVDDGADAPEVEEKRPVRVRAHVTKEIETKVREIAVLWGDSISVAVSRLTVLGLEQEKVTN